MMIRTIYSYDLDPRSNLEQTQTRPDFSAAYMSVGTCRPRTAYTAPHSVRIAVGAAGFKDFNTEDEAQFGADS